MRKLNPIQWLLLGIAGLYGCYWLITGLAMAFMGRGLRLEETALQERIRRGDAPGMVRLLALGASPNQEDSRGCNSLVTAVEMHQFAIAETLLKHGVDTRDRDFEGRSIGDRFKDDPRAVEWLRKNHISDL
jgi:hypothetical protein